MTQAVKFRPLTVPQRRAMAFFRQGQSASLASPGDYVVLIAGRALWCIDTMQALERRGLIAKDSPTSWKATTAGLSWPGALGENL